MLKKVLPVVFQLFVGSMVVAVPEVSYYRDLVSANLYQLQMEQTHGQSREAVIAMNDAEYERLKALPAPAIIVTSKGIRANSISEATGKLLIDSVTNHPVVSFYEYQKYNQPGTELGFCFGRAVYMHLALLEMGVNKDSIKKIWAIGRMRANDQDWGYHVATIVRGDTGDWFVLDNYNGTLMTVTEWMRLFEAQNEEGDMRYYITDPEKFGPDIGKYSRVQLGLDLKPEQDWYRNYFVDLMDSFKPERHVLRDLGLPDLRTPVPAGFVTQNSHIGQATAPLCRDVFLQ